MTRQHQILQAIIEDYVSLREPVGSKALVERHQLGISSATVRHEMVRLEEQGLIEAPHSSSGRVPTAQGYRYFVDEISSLRPLRTAEKNAIHRLLDTSESLEDVYSQTVRLLSQLTHKVALLQLPSKGGDKVQHIELISVSPYNLMVLLIDNAGQVHQKMMVLPELYPDDSSQMIQSHQREVLELLKGETYIEGHQRILHRSNPPAPHSNLAAIFQGIEDLLLGKQSSRLLISGTSFLAESTEDFPRSIAPVLEALEEQVTMLQLLNAMTENDQVTVRIGSENQEQNLSETSIVATAYGTSSSHNLGIVGPTRMDYSSSMATVRGVAHYLSKILGT